MRMRKTTNTNEYESRTDYTNRDLARKAEGRRVLLPDVQGEANRAEVSAEMEGYASTEGGEREICSEICEEESRHIMPGQLT